ncbi:UNVERIFIED_CONTAM: Calpain-2 catalytic subunit [Gekko kuhli]
MTGRRTRIGNRLQTGRPKTGLLPSGGIKLSYKRDNDILSTYDKLVTDGSGKLGLKEFHVLWTKIQKYQKIYREIDVDRSGTMNSYEMRRALEQAGFKLDCQLHQVIVARFADEQLIIDFDNFVRCLIRLETLFKIFKKLDTEKTGTIQMNLVTWVCFTII